MTVVCICNAVINKNEWTLHANVSFPIRLCLLIHEHVATNVYSVCELFILQIKNTNGTVKASAITFYYFLLCNYNRILETLPNVQSIVVLIFIFTLLFFFLFKS